MKSRTLPIGSISSGTLIPEDLLEALGDAAHLLQLTRRERVLVRKIRGEFRREGEADIDGDVEALFDILNGHVPDFCYFGAHEGDGADFGVWPSNEVPFHGPATDEIGKGDCLPSASVIKQGHWLRVNDHGNCTLYRKVRTRGKGHKWVECWSLV